MNSLARVERAAICDSFDKLGPDAPTLCAGWKTRDLAAHLVLRETRPDAAAGVVVPVLAGWTKRVQSRLAAGDFTALIRRLRNGPPTLSWCRPPLLDAAGNGVEFFVHHEDVRRAQPGWQPRTLDAATTEYLWRRACRMANFALRRENQAIEFVRDDTGERQLVRRPRSSSPTASERTTISGAPAELLMFVFGRRDHALVHSSAVR